MQLGGQSLIGLAQLVAFLPALAFVSIELFPESLDFIEQPFSFLVAAVKHLLFGSQILPEPLEFLLPAEPHNLLLAGQQGHLRQQGLNSGPQLVLLAGA